MEIAWKRPRGEVHCFFIYNGTPDIPPHVRRITGIEPGWLQSRRAVAPEEMGKLFSGVAEGFLLVAHHAVYEKNGLIT